MSIKHKIKFKKPIEEKKEDLHEVDRPRFEEHDEKDYEQKCGAFFKDEPVYVNEDEEYAKHLTKFFKGEVE